MEVVFYMWALQTRHCIDSIFNTFYFNKTNQFLHNSIMFLWVQAQRNRLVFGIFHLHSFM